MKRKRKCFRRVDARDRSVLELIDSDFTYLNERSAMTTVDDVGYTNLQEPGRQRPRYPDPCQHPDNHLQSHRTFRMRQADSRANPRHTTAAAAAGRRGAGGKRGGDHQRLVASDWKIIMRKQSVPPVIQRWIRWALRWKTSTASALMDVDGKFSIDPSSELPRVRHGETV